MRRRLKGKTIHLLDTVKRGSGFTVWELVVVLVLLSIVILIALSLYLNYIDNAKIIIAQETVKTARDNINFYSTDNGKFPDSIDFNGCVDETGRPVFTNALCNQVKEDLHSILYSYNDEKKQFTLTARAKNRKLTIITATADKISK